MFTCDACVNSFTRKDALRRHQQGRCKPTLKRGISDMGDSKRPRIEPEQNVTKCASCNVDVSTKYLHQHNRSLDHKNKLCVVQGAGVSLIDSAFKRRIATYRISADKDYLHVKEFLAYLKQKTLDLIRQNIDKYTAVKVGLELFGMFSLQTKDREETKSFNTRFNSCNASTDLNIIYNNFMDVIDNKTSEFQERDSGWTLKKLLFIELSVNKYNPMKASSYIPLPKPIEDKKAVINIQNSDNKCFMWSVLASLYPAKDHSDRITNYQKYEDVLNFTDIEFPVKLKDIGRFEQLNNISVNVYGIDSILQNGKTVYEIVGPLHFTDNKRNQHVNLLLIDDNTGNSHYCFIRNLSRLVRSQLSKHKNRKFLCDGCLVSFGAEGKLREHEKYDCNHIKVRLPTTAPRTDKFGHEVPGNILKFESIEKKLKMPFVAYADFECLLLPIQQCQRGDGESYTDKTHLHQPYSFGYYIKCCYDDTLSKYVTYRGQDCAEIFCRSLEEDVRRIYNNYLKHIVPMVDLTEEEQLTFIASTVCHICEKPLYDDRVRDHDHLTGRYRGPAHNTCNLNYKIPSFIPVFFHNLSNYDAHLFIKALGAMEDTIDVIAENKEKYISFSKHVMVDTEKNTIGGPQNKYIQMRFLDSFRFMPMSLDGLASNLNDVQCCSTKKHFPDSFYLMRRKGVFPYSFIDSFDKLNFEQLPERAQFYDTLKKCHISEEDYTHAQKVWTKFDINNMGEYSDLYLKTDVLLLTDIFEAFRSVCMDIYGLDPANFFTAPGLSWASMLKYTNVELELLTDIDMVHFIKKGIRGGVSQCSIRYLQANNKYMANYDESKPTCFINYLDATNLYGKSLSSLLPLNSFKFLTQKQMAEIDVLDISEDSPKGYIFEVDLAYPEELHDEHNEFPFCPENIIPPGSKQPKLIPNLNNKSKYIIHYRNLQQCLKVGLKLTMIHRVLSFNQSAWLKEYVDLNTRMRNQASNQFEKMFYKLMNNSIFGKTMENVDKRTDVRLITHWENKGRRLGAGALIAKPHFKNRAIFSENLTAIHMDKLSVRYDKPIYIGFCVLDLAKHVMYDFYYNYIKKAYGDNVKLAYTDTDSLILQTYTDDFYVDIRMNLDKYDTSNFKDDNQFGIPRNESVVGKMKDEYGGKLLWEFVGTGSKAYVINVEGELHKTAKGVQKNVIIKELTLRDYKNVVLDKVDIHKNMQSFRSYKHQVYTELRNKVALSWRDDKRYIVSDGSTLAWGHHKIV